MTRGVRRRSQERSVVAGYQALQGYDQREGRERMAEKLSSQSVLGWLKNHPGWTRKSNALLKEFKFSSFRDSIVFVNRIAGLADDANHHPDILVQYNRVHITLSTHSAGGITEKDLKLAEQLDFSTSAG